MKTGNLREFGLNPRQCRSVQKVLQPGEQVLWAGQPVARGCFSSAADALGWYGVVAIFVVIGFFLLYMAAGRDAGCAEWIASCGWLLVSLSALVVPSVQGWQRRRVVYVITNCRAVVCAGKTESWTLAPDMVVSNVKAADGSGNLVFAVRLNEDRSEIGDSLWNEYGFMGIRDVRMVEEILEKAVAERENSPPPPICPGDADLRKSLNADTI